MGRPASLLLLGAVLPAFMLGGCSGGGPAPPPSSGFNGASDCKTTKAELNKLVGQGVGNDVNAASSGRVLSSEAQARVDRYNALLEVYLGQRCHV